MKIFVIDNYDSFTYNLVHILREIEGIEMEIRRNDRFEIDEIEGFDKILISPGPGIPSEAGHTLEVIQRYATSKSILGICLGHQAIVEAFGGKIRNLSEVLHGIKGEVKILPGAPLYKTLPPTFAIGHYHSWVADEENLPDCLQVTAHCGRQLIMSVSHREYDVHGIQFHPESVLTENGPAILQNFLFPQRENIEYLSSAIK